MHGCMLKDDFCAGKHCRHSPRVEKDGKVECVVCGGTGNGKDGVYAVQDAQDEEEEDENVEETLAPPASEGLMSSRQSSDREENVRIVSSVLPQSKPRHTYTPADRKGIRYSSHFPSVHDD